MSGAARVDGHAFRVSGTLHTDGTLSGTVDDPTGRTAARVRGAPAADGSLAGTVTRVGTDRPLPWRLPRLALPAATDP